MYMLYVLVHRSLALLVVCALLVASVIFAYQQSHQPRSATGSLSTERHHRIMNALVATDYGGPEVTIFMCALGFVAFIDNLTSQISLRDHLMIKVTVRHCFSSVCC